MVQKELFMHLIGYNLIRAVMLQSAHRHDAPLERLSFKGSVDAVRQYGTAISQAKTKAKAARLVRELLRVLVRRSGPSSPRSPRTARRQAPPQALLPSDQTAPSICRNPPPWQIPRRCSTLNPVKTSFLTKRHSGQS